MIQLHLFFRENTVDFEGIREQNEKFASNPQKYVITWGIRLGPNALAKAITITDIVNSIEGCVGVIATMKQGQNALLINVIQECNASTALSRENMEAKTIQGLSGTVELQPIPGAYVELNAARSGLEISNT